jgi:hypothetical protein
VTLRYDLRINQGETFQLSIPVFDSEGDPMPVSGMIARAQVRAYANAPAVLHNWSLTDDNIALVDNNVILKVPAAVSAAWTWRTGRWDVELVDGAGAVTRLAEGFVIVHPEVSRS